MTTYSLASNTWGKEELSAAMNVLASGQYTMGEKVKEFERAFAKYVGSKYAIMTNSGSSANLVMISTMCQAGYFKPGDEIIVPAVSWSTTYFPLAQYGLVPVFVDVDLDTFNMEHKSVEKCITDKTKAVLFVTLLGNPSGLGPIAALCKKENIELLVDNCEGFGSTYRAFFGEKQGQIHVESGTAGIMGTYSTFFSHHLQTMEGGMIVTDNINLRDYATSIRSHGWDRHLDHKNAFGVKNEDNFYKDFNIVTMGYNVRPTEISGAVGVEQIKKADVFNNTRVKNNHLLSAFLLSASFSKSGEPFKGQDEVFKRQSVWSSYESSYFGFGFILDKKYNRDSVCRELNVYNIATRPIVAGNFTRSKVAKYMDFKVPYKLKNADIIHMDGFFIGNDSKDLSNELEYFTNAIMSII